MFFYPSTIEIISRKISFNLSEGILRKSAQEKISFQNHSSSKVNEIAIEVENFRSNLSITDEDNKEIIYLTNEKLKDKDELPLDIKENLGEKGRDKRRNILWLILNKPIGPNEYGMIFINYIEYAKRSDKHSDNKKYEMAYINHKTYREAFYLDTIYFYANETVSVFINWDDALEINSSNFYYKKGRNNETEEFDPSEINFRNNWVSFGLSKSKRDEKSISTIFLVQSFVPQKEQLRLIQVLTIFTLLFPLTEFVSIALDRVSYLFASLEVETVLILTLAFADTRTILISYKKFIIIALTFTGVLFVIALSFLFGFLTID